MECIWENQELFVKGFSMMQTNFSAASNYPNFTNQEGESTLMSDIELPQSSEWFWMTDWSIDTTISGLNRNANPDDLGWIYGSSFSSIEKEWSVNMNISSISWVGGLISSPKWIRRRRWIRIRKKRRNFSTPVPKNEDELVDVSVCPLISQGENSTDNFQNELNAKNKLIEKLLLETSSELDKERRKRHASIIKQHLEEAEALQTIIDLLDPNHALSEDEEDERTSAPQSAPFIHFRSSVTINDDWQRDEEAPNCVRCNHAFGLFLRKHHCRRCGYIFCHECSSQVAPISADNIDLVRVCNMCYQSLISEDSPLTSMQIRQLSPLPQEDLSNSTMGHCPVCDVNLYGLVESEVEGHVAKCIQSYSLTNSNVLGREGHRYLVQEYKSDTEMECTICFEQMKKGTQVARLKCLCIFHENCIQGKFLFNIDWFAHPHGKQSCPLHGQ